MSKKYLQSEKQNLLNGIGTELCWGWSPAVDFTSLIDDDHLYVNGTAATQAATTPSTTEVDTDVTLVVSKGKTLEDDIFGSDSDDAGKDNPSEDAKGHDDNAISILLVGAGDIRHIFRTLAEVCVKNRELSKEGTHRIPPIHFYLYEPNLRVQARHLLFLQWLVDSVFSFDELEDRVSIFLEAFGNSMVREVTSEHIKLEAKRVLRMMGFDEGKLAGRVNLDDELKSKERDFIEHQVRQWTRPSTDASARIEEIWLARLRTEMAERFDNKDNLIDYDFTFGLLEQTHGIRFPEYRLWRNTGVAYDYCHINPRKGVHYNYTEPNKTLCHFQRKFKERVRDITPTTTFDSSDEDDNEVGSSKEGASAPQQAAPIAPLRDNEARPTRGLSEQPTVGVYLGDIKAGPFFCFGIDSENPHLHHRNMEGQLKYGNGVMAMHNVRAWLYQLLTGGARWPWADHKLAWDDPGAYNFLPPGTKKDHEHAAEIPAATFTCVGLDLERLFTRRAMRMNEEIAKGVPSNSRKLSKYKFDAAFVGANSTQFMTPAFFDSLADHAVVVAETIKFVIDAGDEAKVAFNEKIRDLCKNGGVVGPPTASKPPRSWIQNNVLTDKVHANVVPLKKREVTPTTGQARADLRYASPYQLVFTNAKL